MFLPNSGNVGRLQIQPNPQDFFNLLHAVPASDWYPHQKTFDQDAGKTHRQVVNIPLGAPNQQHSRQNLEEENVAALRSIFVVPYINCPNDASRGFNAIN
ncbi:Hypothetical protein NTJ_03783 [Nesidiocoris tenuis]|uniref:Uncharacterized protein n=1 Tax=Nesidiocoris tenuis TaxID=355587 RepID=A0ABN7AJC1_9HEMI|nr:Hypothetical protein NTJ_03783 [Nesidiocoris tenuis]